MFCVCVHLPYEHQIKKIHPVLINKFYNNIEALAMENGCKKIIKRDSSFYFFDDSGVSPVFFVVRFLYSISLSLSQFYNKINEIKIIVEHFSNTKNFESIIDLITQLKNISFHYNKLLIGSKATNFLKKYISISNIQSSSLALCESFIFFENLKKTINLNGEEKHTLIIKNGQNYIKALYNFILLHPLFESSIEILSEIEKKTYFETRSSLSFFSKNRFNSSLPKYFLDAFIIYVKLYLKIYKAINKYDKIDIYIDSNDKKNYNEAEKLKQIIGDAKISIINNNKFDIETIPEDLLELIYLLLYSRNFIFCDEVRDFFFTITHSMAFEEIIGIMAKTDIIVQANYVFSYKDIAFKNIEKKIKNKKEKLHMYIAQFLFNKYEKAEIVSSIGLKDIFNLFNFEYKEKLIIDIFFNYETYYCFIELPKKNYDKTVFDNIDIINKYKLAVKLEKEGALNKALAITKDINAYFKKNIILSGEYKSVSLLAFIFLKNNNINDSLTYCIYALELAKKTKNDAFICEALLFLSIVSFLQKDLKSSFSILQELGNYISLSFRQEWKVFYLFLQGRLYIEIGEGNKASVFFKLAKDFANLYFQEFQNLSTIWYARALVYDGKIEKGQKILQKYISSNVEAILFYMESYILSSDDPEKLKEKHKEIDTLKQNYNKLLSDTKLQINSFSFLEDFAWYNIYKKTISERLFESFYNYYMIIISTNIEKLEREKYLTTLSNIAMESLYSKDNNSSIYLYLCYKGQCQIDGEPSGVALAFLSKASKVMQSATSFMYDTSMRDKFMKQNPWNAKLLKVALENKLI